MGPFAAALPPEATRLLRHADSLRRAGRLRESLAWYERAMQAAPGHPLPLALAGRVLLGLGHHGEACLFLERARRLAPGDPEILLDVMSAQALARDVARASALWAALARRPERAVPRAVMIARELERLDRRREARVWYARALRAGGADRALLLRFAWCRLRLGEVDGARAAFEEVLIRDPDCAEAWFGLGSVHQAEGRFEEACRAHGRAVELDPLRAEAWESLAVLLPEEKLPGFETRLRGLLEDARLAQEGRIALLFALARTLERCRRFEEAFDAYARANAILRAREPFDLEAHERLVARIERSAQQLAFAREELAQPRPMPILILGMPRSGTTLVERILASHPDIAAGGERQELRHLARELRSHGARRAFPEGTAELDRTALERLRGLYLDPLRRIAHGRRFVSDKLPGNYLRLGLFARLFPAAPVLWCRRDPRDVCVSCFTTHFADGLRFSTDLATCARVWTLQERLMRFWSERLPNPLLEVRHERLVADPEREVRRLFAFLGLAPPADWPRFYERAGPVLTASFHQVRRPIDPSGVGRWRRFRTFLPPALLMLGGDR